MKQRTAHRRALAGVWMGLVVTGCVGDIAGSGDPTVATGGDRASVTRPGDAARRGDVPGSAINGSPGAPLPGGSGAPGALAAVSCTGGPSVAPGKWRRLTAAQYAATIRDLLAIEADTSGFLLDTTAGPFASNGEQPPQDTDIDRYRDAAETIAQRAAQDVARLLKCDTRTVGEDACAARFIGEFGARAYRRPLVAEEKAALTTLYAQGKEDGFAQGIRLVVEGVLQSPNFLYLMEFGVDPRVAVVRLTGFELATRLSYSTWGTTPDADLTLAASTGKLDSAEGVRAQAVRLTSDARFADSASDFAAQLFGIHRLGRDGAVTKDPKRFPEFDAGLRRDMQAESRRFVSTLFSKGDASVEAMFTANHSFPAGALLKVYGLAATRVAADGRVEWTDGTRAGLLTHASVLASHPATPSNYGAVHRGRMIRLDLLCDEIPAAPGNIKFGLPANADKLSQQELLRVHQENPTCTPCHKLMDPLGFTLENYDDIGRYRTKTPGGETVNASGELTGTDVDGVFTGPMELAGRLGRSQTVRACVAKQWFRYSLGRDPAQADVCSLKVLGDALLQGRGDMRAALVNFTSSDAFRFRQGGSR